MKQPVVALSAPQKPYHPSPVQDSKRCGFGGLLSRFVVHAASRDEEDNSSAEIGTGGERKEKFWFVSLRGATSLLLAQEKEARGQRREAKRRERGEANSQQSKGCTVRIQTPLSQNLFSFRVTFRIPVVRGKNLDIGSAHSRNPRRGAS